MEKRKILVTGGTGFVGSHIVTRLLREGHDVHVTERPNSSRAKEELASVAVPNIHAIDLSETDSVAVFLEKLSPTEIYHLGADLHQHGIDPPVGKLLRTNVETTEAILQYARLHNATVVNTGTFTEYQPSAKPVSEEDTLFPQEFYSLTKMTATLRAQQLGKQGVSVVTLRPFTPFGPGMREGRLVRVAIEHAQSGTPIPLSSPKVTRDFIYVDDLVDCYLLAMQHARECKGEVFNAGTGKATTLAEFAELVLLLTQSKSKLEWSAQAGLSYDGELWQANIEKAKRILDWQPKHDLRSGLQKTIEWYRGKVK